MRNRNFGIGVLHVKRQILTCFCDVISLLALVCIVLFDRAYKEVSVKILKIFHGSVFVIGLFLQKAMYVPVTLTYEGQMFLMN